MTLVVIGAVIGEFIGSVGGLGNLLLTANSQLDSPLAWAALVWLSVLGILLFAAVVLSSGPIVTCCSGSPWSHREPEAGDGEVTDHEAQAQTCTCHHRSGGELWCAGSRRPLHAPPI